MENNVSSLLATVISQLSNDKRVEIIKEIIRTSNIASILIIDVPKNDEILMISGINGLEDVTDLLSYDSIARYLLIQNKHEIIINKEMLELAKNVLINIWNKITGAQHEETIRLWIEEPGIWMFNTSKRYVLKDMLTVGPVLTDVLLCNPNNDICPNISLWNIIINEKSYAKYLEFWG